MFPLARMLSLAAASALVALTAVSLSAGADELPQNLGPVGPHQPILHHVARSHQFESWAVGDFRHPRQQDAQTPMR